MHRVRTTLLVFLILTVTPVFSYQNGIEVKTTSPNVNVYLDGKFVGITESAFGMNVLRIEDIKPGSHRIRCEAKGFDSFNKSVTVTATDVLPLEVRFTETRVKIMSLDATSGAQVKSTGTIKVISKPTGATALLNGRQKGLADLVYEDVPVGEKEIEVYFNKRKSDEYLTLSFELSKDDNVIVTADFFNGKIYTDAKYKVTFNSTPKGVVYLNGKKLGNSPITKTLQTGNYDLEFRRKGYSIFKKTYTVSRNDFVNVKLKEFPKYAFLQVEEDGVAGKEVVKLYGDIIYENTTPTTLMLIDIHNPLIEVGNQRVENLHLNENHHYTLKVRNILPQIVWSTDLPGYVVPTERPILLSETNRIFAIYSIPRNRLALRKWAQSYQKNEAHNLSLIKEENSRRHILNATRGDNDIIDHGRLLLKQGDKGQVVIEVQEILSELGYLKNIWINGEYDARTAERIKEFQKANHLSDDGIAGPSTLIALFKYKDNYNEERS